MGCENLCAAVSISVGITIFIIVSVLVALVVIHWNVMKKKMDKSLQSSSASLVPGVGV